MQPTICMENCVLIGLQCAVLDTVLSEEKLSRGRDGLCMLMLKSCLNSVGMPELL